HTPPHTISTLFPYTTLFRSSIGLGYIYTDWLAQIDYTTPEISGFSFTVGIFDPINSIGDAGTTVGKKAPGIHGKLSDTVDLGGGDRKSTRLNSSHQIISYAV